VRGVTDVHFALDQGVKNLGTYTYLTPKSASFTVPSPVRSTFALLMSLWKIPLPCKYARLRISWVIVGGGQFLVSLPVPEPLILVCGQGSRVVAAVSERM
jgi:hypothetical protein